MARSSGHSIELLGNGDLLVSGAGRICKGTRDHELWLEAANRGEAHLIRRTGVFGGAVSPPEPSAAAVLERLGVSNATLERQQQAATDAAYGGGLDLRELRVMRQADLIPYDH
jgi:hypothetical protein